MKQRIFEIEPVERGSCIERLRELLRDRDEIIFAYLYGSFAEDLPFHDIDVGVYVSQIREEEATLYSITLGQSLSKEMKIPVDVRVLNFAPVLFLYRAIRGELVLERDEDLRAHVVEQTIQKYLDLKPMVRAGVKEAFGA